MNSNEKFFSKIGFNYAICFILATILQIILINVFGITNADLLNDYNVMTILAAICNYIIPFPVLLFLMKKLESEKLEKHQLNVKTFLIYICITFTLMWIGNIIGIAITSLIGTSIQVDVSNPIQELINSTDIWLNLLLISIIAPIFEEFFFRKLLIDRTIKYGAKISIILSAALFGLMHGNLNQFFYAFLMGGFFAYVYIRTGKLIYPIILHMTINLMGSVMSLLVLESTTEIGQGIFTAFNMSVVLLYMTFLIVALIIGLISIYKFRKVKLDEYKPKIELRQPLKTAFLNYGMLLFVGLCIVKIVYQIFA